MITIELTEQEAIFAATIGILRRYRSAIRKSKNSHGFDNNTMDPLTTDIHGAGGELAAAKALGVYWPATVDTYDKPDLGRHTQVRTAEKDHYKLIIRNDAKDHEIYVHVTGRMPFYKVWGYIKASDAKQDKYLANPNGREYSWFVPASDLIQIT